jgi:Beta-ketoacyl synthase, N-terminal domain
VTALGVRVGAVGVLTGWGDGIAALPEEARVAAGGRAVVPLARPVLPGERFRRATRECLLGVAAVEAMLRDADLERGQIAGARTAVLFVTAAGYGASNVEWLAGQAGTLHFPYTAPSVLPGEVAIEFGLTGPYIILIGGATATVDALWQAGRLVADRQCDRALVLTVETFEECEALWRRARWTVPPPLVESAACALLERGDVRPTYRATTTASPLELDIERRAGRTLSCAPLLALALARAGNARTPAADTATVSGTWRTRTAAIDLDITTRTPLSYGPPATA